MMACPPMAIDNSKKRPACREVGKDNGPLCTPGCTQRSTISSETPIDSYNSKKRPAPTSADAGASMAAAEAAEVAEAGEDLHQFDRRRARACQASRSSQVITPASTPTTPGDQPEIATAATPTAMAPATRNALP